ncbi:hypothetical protein OH76DRAFT_1102785 [Lentinus brumalis]|uniref:Uncharacterized protein n=1 Tax=Lentinus brumalis TaxID=2498619 RepID=A0A371CVP4_9APHY|nr:hypothetical protein OH76DRAFT_1102785 [Polyporus brumalis]
MVVQGLTLDSSTRPTRLVRASRTSSSVRGGTQTSPAHPYSPTPLHNPLSNSADSDIPVQVRGSASSSTSQSSAHRTLRPISRIHRHPHPLLQTPTSHPTSHNARTQPNPTQPNASQPSPSPPPPPSSPQPTSSPAPLLPRSPPPSHPLALTRTPARTLPLHLSFHRSLPTHPSTRPDPKPKPNIPPANPSHAHTHVLARPATSDTHLRPIPPTLDSRPPTSNASLHLPPHAQPSNLALNPPTDLDLARPARLSVQA